MIHSSQWTVLCCGVSDSKSDILYTFSSTKPASTTTGFLFNKAHLCTAEDRVGCCRNILDSGNLGPLCAPDRAELPVPSGIKWPLACNKSAKKGKKLWFLFIATPPPLSRPRSLPEHCCIYNSPLKFCLLLFLSCVFTYELLWCRKVTLLTKAWILFMIATNNILQWLKNVTCEKKNTFCNGKMSLVAGHLYAAAARLRTCSIQATMSQLETRSHTKGVNALGARNSVKRICPKHFHFFWNDLFNHRHIWKTPSHIRDMATREEYICFRHPNNHFNFPGVFFGSW